MDEPKRFKDFLREYLAWAEAGAPKHPDLDDDFGLCCNFVWWGRNNSVSYAEARYIYTWMPLQHSTADDPSYPFHPELNDRARSTNPRRIAWIKGFLANA